MNHPWVAPRVIPSCTLAALLALAATAGTALAIPFPPHELRSEKHSMRDPVAYARSRVAVGLRGVIDSGRPPAITVVQGGDAACRKRFGDLRLAEVRDRFDGGKDTILLRDEATGRWFDCRNYGSDMALHKALIYHFAGVPRDRLEVVPDPTLDRYNQLFVDTVRLAPDLQLAIIGARRSLARNFTLRKHAALQAAFLERALAEPGFADTLKASLERSFRAKPAGANWSTVQGRTDELLRIVATEPPSVFFASSRRYFQLRAFQDDLQALLAGPAAAALPALVDTHGRLKGGAKGKAGRKIDGGFGMQRFVVTGVDGVRKSLYAFKHPYGNQAETLAQHLAAQQPTDLLFIGSAGGLAADLQPGDIVIPTSFQTLSAEMTFAAVAGTNRARTPEILALPGFKASPTGHCSVFSPLVETVAVADAMRARGIGSVDCEAAHLFAAPASATKVGVMLTITDLPGRGATLEDVDREARPLRDAEMRLLDGVIAFFGISDVEIE